MHRLPGADLIVIAGFGVRVLHIDQPETTIGEDDVDIPATSQLQRLAVLAARARDFAPDLALDPADASARLTQSGKERADGASTVIQQRGALSAIPRQHEF